MITFLNFSFIKPLRKDHKTKLKITLQGLWHCMYRLYDIIRLTDIKTHNYVTVKVVNRPFCKYGGHIDFYCFK